MMQNPMEYELQHRRTMELILQAQQGDKQAEETLLNENMALIHSVAKRFRDQGVDYDDIFQMGCMGFIKSIKRFDMSYNVRFSTYAVPMIMGEIRRILRDDGMVKVSRSIREMARRIMQVQEEMQSDLGRSPSVMEVAHRCGIRPDEVAFYLESLVDPISVDEPVTGKDGNQEVQQLDHIAGQQDQEDQTLDSIVIKEAFAKLQPREQKIIYLRYYKGRTQHEIARIMGVSQVQISRLEKKILTKMRSSISS